MGVVSVKIIIEDCRADEEEEIIIRCKDLDESLLSLIQSLKMGKNKIAVTHNGNTTMVEPKDVFYFEAVDNRIFLYTKQEVYETKLRLYEIEKRYEGTDFLRTSKSTIINISKIKYVSPAYSGRLEALLKNGEKIIISRQYVGELRKKLEVLGG